MKSRLLRPLAILASLCAITLGLASHSFAQPPTLVEVSQVENLSFHDQITLIGRTEAKTHSRIVSEVSGRVMSIDAPEGNAVRKSARLVTIDPSRLQYALKAKEAQAAQAKQQAFLAETNKARVTELAAQKLVSESTIDSAQAWALSAAARFDELDAERANLALDLERSTIRAPYTGYTLERYVDVGDWVSTGTTVYEMVDLSSIMVTCDLPERHFGSLAIGSPVTITVSNDREIIYNGTVTGIARSASSTTHTFPVMITVPNPDEKLGGGKLVRATLNLNQKFESLAVHKDAVVRQGMNTMVYTIAEGKAVPVPVTIGSTFGDMIAVTGQQLTDGMTIVVRGNERIFPGAPVMTPQGSEESADDGTSLSSASSGETKNQ